MGRTPQEDLRIEQRRQQVAELYLQGWSQAAIARELSVSQPTVSSDLQAIRAEWRESRVRDFDEAVGIELKKLECLEREAWSAWRRSQHPAESTKVTQVGSNKKAEKTVKEQHGDPRYLELVYRAITGRRTLLGLDAPTRIAPTGPDGKQPYHAHVMAELMRLAEDTRRGPAVVDAQYIEHELSRLSIEVDGPSETTDLDGQSESQEIDDEPR
ncbi:MAG: terminase gpP N-terminus-related DNA-binding protein [Planctomycetota bacterium]|jgi:hypothetical protein